MGPGHPVVTCYTDFICPWCYIGDAYLQEAQKTQPFEINYVMFPLHPDTPEGGITLETLFHGRNVDITGTQKQIREKAHRLGLPYAIRTHTYNSRNAQLIGKAMTREGVFEKYKAAVFNKYFAEGCNIGSPQVLQQILDSLDPKLPSVVTLINDPQLHSELERDWKYCRLNKIHAVPAFQFEDRYCVGAQPSANILQLFDR